MKTLFTSYDLFLTPILLIILYLICYIYRTKKYSGTPLYKYFILAWTVRVFGTFATIAMYEYYYNSGDTFTYQSCSTAIYDSLWFDYKYFLNIIFSNYEQLSLESWNFLYERVKTNYIMSFYHGDTSMVIKVGALFSIFTFNSYVCISLLISFMAFLGCWRLFLTFYYLYPEIHKPLAIAILFIPSVFFWGSGYMKDPLCLAAIGFLTYACYEFFLVRKNRIINFFIILASSYLIISIKIYIIIAFVPSLILWVLFSGRNNIKNKILKKFLFPIIIGITAFLVIVATSFLGRFSTKYSLEGVLNTAIITQTYLKSQTKIIDGFGYDLGELQPTIPSLISFIPKGANVTLFRPYLWEAPNPLAMVNALEASFTLLFTLYILFLIGPLKFFKYLFNNPDVLFAFSFSFLFAAAIGISTYNFGSLSRYKLPCLPFYFSGLIIMLHLSKEKIHTVIWK